MRISTSLIYDSNVATIGRQQVDLLHTQQQLSTNSRVVSASDDPVAAARALEVSQSTALLAVQKTNQGTVTDALQNLDSQLGAIHDVLDYVRERVVQAGNSATLTSSDLQSIATDVKAQFDSLLNLGNTRNAQGEYLYSGYKGDTQAFTGNLSGVNYQGDQGARALQVSNSRQIPVSVNGNELFMNIGSVNGVFTSSTSSSTAIVSDGTVSGPAAYSGTPYEIQFTSANTFDVLDTTNPLTPTTISTGNTYTSGQSISLPDPAMPATIQIQIAISGTPSVGDTFKMTPGSSSDMFSTIKQFIVGLENTTGAGYTQMVSDTLGQLDNAMDNVSRLRSQAGSRQVEVAALGNLGDDLNIQYTDRMNTLVGLDYVSAISDFQQQQTYLEAARNTFSKISGLSLFNFIS